MFAAIKNYVRFSDLSPEELATFAGIESLLTKEEICDLLLHLFNKSTKPSPVECNTARKRWSKRLFTVLEKSEYVSLSASEFTGALNVNQTVWIKRIFTTLPDYVENLELSIYKGNENLVLGYRILSITGIWFFGFDKPRCN